MDLGFDVPFNVTEVKVKKNYESWRILLLFDLECSNLEVSTMALAISLYEFRGKYF
jgi:hypothetical protein